MGGEELKRKEWGLEGLRGGDLYSQQAHLPRTKSSVLSYFVLYLVTCKTNQLHRKWDTASTFLTSHFHFPFSYIGI